MTQQHQLHRLLPPLLIVLAVVLAFFSSLQGEFFEIDDVETIRDNPHIRRLWPPSEPLCLPLWNTGATVDTRPVLALSLALNYQLTGDAPWGFHLVNLLVHLAAALLLFGIVRRTLLCLPEASRPRAGPTAFAFVAAAVWAVHPLQTEAVTYAAQRAVSLMGMFYLLTLYASIRAFTSTRPRLWSTIAIIACALGMGTKESMVTAPVLVILYDYVFRGGLQGRTMGVARSRRERGHIGGSETTGQDLAPLWRQRRGLYLGLLSTWLIMLFLVAATFEKMAQDASSTGLLPYAGSQPLVILKYLRLAFWPRGLVLDYTNHISQGWQEILLPTLPLVILFVFSLIGTAKRRPVAFLGLAFFVLLSPSSSVAPTMNVYNEHRMYLALAAVVIPALAGLDLLLQWAIPRPNPRRAIGALLSLAVVAALAVGTNVRNLAWRTELAFWTDNVAKRPSSSTAHNNMGSVLLAQGRARESVPHYREAMRLRPASAEHHNNLANVLQALGRPREAVEHYREALRIKPDYAEAHNNWGMALAAAGQPREAMAHYQQAVQLDPDMGKAHVNLGNALQALGRTRDALGHYRQAVQAQPDYADAHNNVANALLLLGQPHNAIEHYREALRLEPGHVAAHYGCGLALRAAGQVRAASEHFEQALRLNPDHAAARKRLREMKARMGEGGKVED
ncbi:MAG: tetratricopeptide repeat protein [Verrucomicrobia bacterium]|nr:tetratricopeptide repeat protein [Verrucomicrobiota bacterium]MBT7069019.1 tetratricopeptide repeat protein [Verrucomicrobiota bacterium]MBT7700125.1 tetratricopeptide repeat protein [Verrucomicrobiota bacterium]